jgi:LysM repeat protein
MGDSLYTIASKYNVSVSELKEVNGLTNDFLSIGQQLHIPVNDSNYDYYVVVSGDNLYSIASKFNTSVDTLMSINNLTSNKLSIGETLKIPRIDNYSYSNNTSESNYLYYVVKSGDSLYSISNKYGISIDDIKKINNLTSNNLSVGDVLKIIDNYNNNISMGDACYGEGYVEVKYITYVVRNGDNLYKIAKKYNVSVDSIKLLNNLTSNNLVIGQILKIKEDN